MKQLLYNELERINDFDIRKFTQQVLDNAPPEFWICPCSGTGKHHPPEDNGDGGLIRHLIKCSYLSQDLCRIWNLKQEDMDIVVAVTILHDIRKNGDPWGESSHAEHGKIAYDFLERFELKEPEKTQIRNCVRYHMARWTGTKEDFERACRPETKELIVQLTDYFCSRKYASWLPGIEIRQEDIDSFSSHKSL